MGEDITHLMRQSSIEDLSKKSSLPSTYKECMKKVNGDLLNLIEDTTIKELAQATMSSDKQAVEAILHQKSKDEVQNLYCEETNSLNLTTLTGISGCVHIIKYLISLDVPLDTCDSSGLTILHHVIINQHCNAFKCLMNYDVSTTNISNTSLLHLAIITGNKEICKILLKKYGCVNECCIEGWTALHVACASHVKSDLVELLLDYGASLELTTIESMTSLAIAIKNTNIDVALLLLSYGADVNVVLSNSKLTSVHLAACINNISLMTAMIDHGAIITSQDINGITPLYCSIHHNTIKVTELLIKKSVSFHIYTAYHIDYIHKACLESNISILHMLHEHGADVNSRGTQGLTCIHLAVQKQDSIMLPHLEKLGADINITDNNGNSPLHRVVEINNTDILIILLNWSNNLVVNAFNKEGKTPLHIACDNGYMKAVQLLLTKDADPYLYSAQLISPFLLAINSHYKNIAYFLAASRHPSPDQVVSLLNTASNEDMKTIQKLDLNIHTYDRQLRTPLHIAAQQGYAKVVERLLKLGAQTNKSDTQGNTALLLACLYGHLNTASFIIKSDKNLNHKNNNEETCFTLAICSGNLDLVIHLMCKGIKVDYDEQLPINYLNLAVYYDKPHILQNLLSYGAPVYSVDNEGQCALHVASRLGNFPCVKILVKCGAPINTPTESGDRALHLASKSGSVDSVLELVQAGALVNTENRQEQKAIHLAAREGHAKVVEVLLDAGSEVNNQHTITSIDLNLANYVLLLVGSIN